MGVHVNNTCFNGALPFMTSSGWEQKSKIHRVHMFISS